MHAAPLATMVTSIDPLGARPHDPHGTAALVLLAFFCAFVAVRTSARLTRTISWWPGSVKTEALHIHHLVWGICLLLVSGFLAFAAPAAAPWWQVDAVMFGIGAGLTLDEFALWLHLEDVYWAAEGRRSFDAVVTATTFGGLVVLDTVPFGLDRPASTAATFLAGVVAVGLASLCFMKGRVLLGVAGLFIPVLAVVGAVRLARPGSPWARRRYDPAQLQRAAARFDPGRRAARWQDRAIDAFIGAAPAVPRPDR